MIYLDNAATTNHKPLSVKLELLKSLIFYSANPGRSGHTLSMKTAFKIYDARETIQKFFGATSPSNVIFTGSCTEALNLAILGSAKVGGHIVATVNEHNSVLRPLEFLKHEKDISYTLVEPNKNGEIEVEKIKNAVRENTYLIIVNHTSNVTGATSNISAIGKFAFDKKILFLVDGAQSAGHEKIDVQKQHINMLALAGHKGLLGPQGIGVLVINNVNLKPLKFGGTGTNSESLIQPTTPPDGLEAGTLGTPNIMALKKGVDYVEKNFEKINKKIFTLTKFLLDNLKEIEGIKIFSRNPKSGVVSFYVDNFDCNFISNSLNEKYKIYVRSGLHCAPLIHKFLHNENGLVRVSVGHNNKMCEVKKFLRSIKKIVSEK